MRPSSPTASLYSQSRPGDGRVSKLPPLQPAPASSSNIVACCAEDVVTRKRARTFCLLGARSLKDVARGREANLREVVGSIDQPPKAFDYKGSLDQTHLLSVLQTLLAEDARGTLQVHSGGEAFSLTLMEGRVVGANGNGVKGRKALFQALACLHGDYAFSPDAHTPAVPLVDQSFAEILKEAKRRGLPGAKDLSPGWRWGAAGVVGAIGLLGMIGFYIGLIRWSSTHLGSNKGFAFLAGLGWLAGHATGVRLFRKRPREGLLEVTRLVSRVLGVLLVLSGLGLIWYGIGVSPAALWAGLPLMLIGFGLLAW